MRLFFDARDEEICERRGDRRLYWLDDLGAVPFAAARPDEAGFLFAGARPLEDYHRLVLGHPKVRDSPEESEHTSHFRKGVPRSVCGDLVDVPGSAPNPRARAPA